jgi:flagellar hook-length control protein FliK
MSSRALDALFSPALPVRAAEPPQRAEGGAAFAPVLDRALRTSEAAPPGDELAADDEGSATADVGALDVDANATGAETGEAQTEVAVDAGADERDEDEVEISAEAAEAAQAAAAATAVENVAAAVDGDGQAESAAVGAEAVAPSAQQPKNTSPQPRPTPIDNAQGEIDANATVGAADEMTSTDAVVVEQPTHVAPTKLTRADRPAKPAPRRAEAQASDSDEAKHARSATAQDDEQLLIEATDANAETQSTEEVEQADSTVADETALDEVAPTDAKAPSARTDSSHTELADAGAAAPVDATTTTPTTESARGTDTIPPADVNVAATTQPANDNSAHPRGAAALARLAADRSLHAADSHGADDGSPVDRARFVGRVEGAMRAAQQRDGRIQVRLSPPELGSLRIELTIQQGTLAARLEAETPAARNLLLDNLPALRERLAQQDIRIERFDVDLRQDFNTGGGANQHESQDRMARETNWRPGAPRQARGGAVATTPSPTPRGAGGASNAALDVRV